MNWKIAYLVVAAFVTALTWLFEGDDAFVPLALFAIPIALYAVWKVFLTMVRQFRAAWKGE